MSVARTPLGAKDIVVRRTTAAAEASQLTSALSRLNAWGEGTLWIEGIVRLNTALNFLGDISVRGLGTDAGFEYQSTSAQLQWNAGWSYNDATSYAFSMNNAFEHGFTTSAFTPTVGEFVLLYSADAIPNVATHFANGTQSPMELHEIYHWDASSTLAYVRDYIVDNMSTTPLATIVPMYKGVVLDNLRFTMTDGVNATDDYEYVVMKTCHKARIDNCHFDRGAGCLLLTACADTKIVDCLGEGMITADGDGVYGITLVLTNNVSIENCTINGYRHAITTAAGRTSGTTRWGTPLHTTVKNCNITSITKYNISLDTTGTETGAIDTHAEGYDFVVRNCVINIQGATGNTGVTANCRNMRIMNNDFIGGYKSDGTSSAYGVNIYSPDCIVSGNTFQRMFQGVKCEETVDHYNRCNNLVVDDNRFINIRAVPIRVGCGDDQSITNNRFRNCAFQAVGSPQNTEAHIQFGSIKQFACSFQSGGTTLTVTANTEWTHKAGDVSYYEGLQMFFTGAVPSPLSVDTIYYVLDTISDTTCTISATRGGAAITFAAGGSATCHMGHHSGTGHRVCNNVSFQENNDHFIETQNLDTDDVEVVGNTVIGYGGASFSDRYSKDDDFQNEYSSLNTGM